MADCMPTAGRLLNSVDLSSAMAMMIADWPVPLSSGAGLTLLANRTS